MLVYQRVLLATYSHDFPCLLLKYLFISPKFSKNPGHGHIQKMLSVQEELLLLVELQAVFVGRHEAISFVSPDLCETAARFDGTRFGAPKNARDAPLGFENPCSKKRCKKGGRKKMLQGKPCVYWRKWKKIEQIGQSLILEGLWGTDTGTPDFRGLEHRSSPDSMDWFCRIFG